MAHKPDESDALFQLPLSDFTAERNALASRLKKEGHGDEAERVKGLTKPSVSAWAVNQLYWNERKEFDRLLEAGDRVRRAGIADMRAPLDARRAAIAKLLRTAETVLRDADHSPSPDTMRRVESTLDALSALADTTIAGRLTADLTPPGFDALASLFQGAQPEKAVEAVDPRKERIREAEQAVDAARKKVETADRLLQEAETRVGVAESRLHEARERFDDAREHERRMAADAKAATESLEAAERALKKA